MTDCFRLESLALLAQSLRLPIGLVVDELKVEATEACATTAPFVLELASPAEVEIRVSQESVARFLEEKRVGGMKDVEVRAEDGQVVVSGSVRVMVELRIEAVFTLRLLEGRQVFVDLEGLNVPMARGMVEGQLNKVNPILDVTHLPLSVTLTSLSVQDGAVTAKGTADWPQSG